MDRLQPGAAMGRGAPRGVLRMVAAAMALLSALPALAQRAPGDVAVIDPITVTATRRAERAFAVPASVDTIDVSTLHDGQPQVNLSETLVRIPGVFAANRQGITRRICRSASAFGARAAFGVRGVRLYQDGIPVTMPDGQGQTGSFSLLSAQRVEILRGPFSALYGNASGGVISVFTGGPAGIAAAHVLRWRRKLWNRNVRCQARNPLRTRGCRDRGQRIRDRRLPRPFVGPARPQCKLVLDATPATRLTLIGNTQYQLETEDPLGLTRAQWAANPRGVDPAAIRFDTPEDNQSDAGGCGARPSLSGRPGAASMRMAVGDWSASTWRSLAPHSRRPAVS